MRAWTAILMCAWTAWSAEREEVYGLLAQAAQMQGEEYLRVREQIVQQGEGVLATLREAAEDAKLTWQERLAARIAYERIVRGEEIEALRFHDWGSYPPYLERLTHVAGPSIKMGDHVVPKLIEAGVWYYYIELTWKDTKEFGVAWRESPYPRGDRRFSYEWWPAFCRAALEGQPEELYLWWAVADAIKRDKKFLESYDHRRLFWTVIRKKVHGAVPSLIRGWERFVAYEFRDYPDATPGTLELNRRWRRESYPGFLRQF